MTEQETLRQQLELPPLLARLGLTAEALDAMDVGQLREIVRRLQILSRKLRVDGPQTDDELHAWVVKNLNVDVPRVAVCEDHTAPFQFLADLYFERVGSALALANRGGAKTFIVAILHFVNSTFKPGCESLSFGATLGQGNRCYSNIESWCYVRDVETGRKTDVIQDFIDGVPTKGKTKWKTGSEVEVVAGTETAVNGPHPMKAHADEIELMDDGTWNESRGMAVAKKATGPLPEFMAHFNGIIPPQDIVTSTRKSMRGRMQELLEEINEDIRQGNIPQFTLYVWCIWETVAEVAECRCVVKEVREARLKEVGKPVDMLCQCHRVVKGRMKDGSPRTLEKVCQGKAFKGRGWKPYVDLIQTFKRNTPGTWTLQHECREAIDEDNYIQNWDLDTFGIRNYEPRPEYGRIYQGIDWGGTNPHAVLWFQYLTAEVPCFDFNYEPIYLNAGIYVLFKEIYVAGIDTAKLADRVKGIETAYRAQYGYQWKVHGRFMDPQGKGDRILFKRKGMGGAWPVVTRNKEKMIAIVQNLVLDDRFAVDADAAPMFCEEIEAWQKNPKTGNELDEFNHAMSAWRYGISNAEVVEGKRAPVASESRLRRRTVSNGVKQISTANGAHFRRSGPVATTGGSSHPSDQFQMMR